MRLLFSLCFLCLFHVVDAQELWTLERCLKHAAENNLQIQQAYLNQKLSENNLVQSWVAMTLPTTNADANAALNYGRFVDPTTNFFVEQQIKTNSMGLSGRLTLFNGLTQINSVRQNKMSLEANKFALEDTRNNVMLTITRAFLQLLLSKEELKASEGQLKISLEQSEQAQKLLDAGNVPLGNLLDAQAQVARDSMSFIMAQSAVEVSRLTLAILLQLEPEGFDVQPPAILLQEAPDFLNENAQDIFQQALNTQPSMKSAFFNTRSARYRMSAAKGLQYPILSVFYSLRTNYSSGFQTISGIQPTGRLDTIGFLPDLTPVLAPEIAFSREDIPYANQLQQNLAKAFGLSLSVPILNGWQARNAIANSKINYLNAQINEKQTSDRLKQDVYTAHADAKNAHQTFVSARKSKEAFQKSLEYSEGRYDAGVLNSLQYNMARTNYSVAEIQFIRSKYDYIFKMQVLEFYKGNPISLD